MKIIYTHPPALELLTEISQNILHLETTCSKFSSYDLEFIWDSFDNCKMWYKGSIWDTMRPTCSHNFVGQQNAVQRGQKWPALLDVSLLSG